MTPAPTPNKTVKKASPLASPLAYIQRQWRLLALVTLYIFFRPTFEGYIASLLVLFHPSLVSTCIWYGLVFATICYAIILVRRRYVLSESTTLWAIIAFVGWCYYRFREEPNCEYEVAKIPSEWTPQSIHIDLLYIDLLLVIFGCIAVVKVWSWCVRKPVGAKNEIGGYIVDCPAEPGDQDRLERGKMVEDLAEKIFHTDTSRAAFTLGLVAPWGAGKTTFILALKDYLKKQYAREIILLDFNPWMYRKAPNLTQIFFEELSRALAPYNSALASGFVHYVEHILAKDSNVWVQLASRLLSQEPNAKTTSEQYDFLKREIGKLGRKIFIFIDDVDRLDSQELIELFALVRNSSSFPCMSYLLAYDRGYVASQLKRCFDLHTDHYMEKIVQEEYLLAKITPTQLERALNEGLKEIGHADLLPPIKALQIQPIDHIPTIRSVKRICNCILSFPQELKGNVESLDWFILELIRIQYPRLFEFLRGNYMTAFVHYTDGRMVSLVNRDEEDLSGLVYETEQAVDFAEYLHEDQERLELENPSSTLRLIESLWGSKRDKKPMQVNDDKYIGIYFYRTLQEDDIKVAEFRQFLTLSIDDTQHPPMKSIKPYIDRIHASPRWKTFCEMVWKQEANNLNEVVNMLYIAFYLVALNERLNQEQKSKITNWINQTYESLESSVATQILWGGPKSLGIHKGILLYISSVVNGAEQLPIPFAREELEDIKEKLFLEYTEDATSIDPIECYRLWLQPQTRHNVEFAGEIDREKSSHGMNERMREIIEGNIEPLIPYFIQTSEEDRSYRLYLPYPIWTLDKEEVAGEIGDVESFISGLSSATSSPVIAEFQRFFKEWLEYIDVLRQYLDAPRERGLYNRLSWHDQIWSSEWLSGNLKPHQGLPQDNKLFFQVLRYAPSIGLGFAPFDFEVIQPKNISSVSTSTEDPAIEL